MKICPILHVRSCPAFSIAVSTTTLLSGWPDVSLSHHGVTPSFPLVTQTVTLSTCERWVPDSSHAPPKVLPLCGDGHSMETRFIVDPTIWWVNTDSRKSSRSPDSNGSTVCRQCLEMQQFFRDPSTCKKMSSWERIFQPGLRQDLRWDNREHKKISNSPDLRRKGSGEVLWLNNFYRPAWADVELAALNMEVGRRVPTSKSRLPDMPAPGGPAGSEMGVKAVTVSTICQNGKLREAIEALEVRAQTDCPVSKSLFYTVLKECLAKKDLVLGRRVHALAVKFGYELDTFLCNHILRMYASHARLEEAMDVFTLIAKPDAFTWSAIISAHVKHGQAEQAITLYHQMRCSSVKPDRHVFVAVLQACARGADLETGQQVHADLLASGVEPNFFVVSCLVHMYSKCGSLKEAQRLFDRLPQKNVVTWNAMVAGYSQRGMGQEALYLYSAMQEEGIVAPDYVTFVCLLQACASVGAPAVEKGKQLHAQIEERGLQADVVIGCSLVNMYAKCGSLGDAQRLFDGLGQKNVVTWNAMIAGYAQQGMGLKALHLYSAMQEEGTAAPDSVTFVCLLQACASVGTQALEKGKEIHAQLEERGLQLDVVVGGSLVNMYAKCGSLEDAQNVFDGLAQKNVVTWTAMIAGYSQQGMGQEALHLYSAMREDSIAIPNSVTFVCLLQACANVAALHQGRQLHTQIEEQGLQVDVVVANSLINMYAKCGSMVDAQQVFDALPELDIVAWNALIAGYTRQGDIEVVFDLFYRMRQDCIKPDDITFLSLITVCSHGGLVKKGREYFETMSRQYGITPTMEHYTCMVDLLGRAGQLDEALELIRRMPIKPYAVLWHTLLGACRKWTSVVVGRHAFDEAVKLDEKDAAAYVMMCNIYTGAQMWEEAKKMQARRKEVGAWKQPGQSWWTDMSGKVHVFLVGDKQHPESDGIYARLKQLVPKMKKEGYVPHLESSLRGTSNVEKEAHLCGHSEKLAIAYALNKTPEGTTIRIVKNLRVCDDCHRATAYISKIEKRTIICRDASRFHVYKDGQCSCGDYW